MARTGSLLPSGSAGPAPLNVDVVAQALRQAIVSGRLAPGERIKEVPLAEELGVSRGPIREAIRLLAHDGLLRIIPNRGAVVPELSSDDVLEVYAMRAALGSLALHKLMLESDALPLATLERARGRFELAVERGRAPQAAEADLAYQSVIVDSAGLPRVARQFEQLTWQVKIFIGAVGIRYDEQLPQMLEEIDTLHEAIVSRRAAEAERLWREKFERWVRDTVDRLDEGFDREVWVALTSGVAPQRRRRP